jgi:hypothetical protein
MALINNSVNYGKWGVVLFCCWPIMQGELLSGFILTLGLQFVWHQYCPRASFAILSWLLTFRESSPSQRGSKEVHARFFCVVFLIHRSFWIFSNSLCFSCGFLSVTLLYVVSSLCGLVEKASIPVSLATDLMLNLLSLWKTPVKCIVKSIANYSIASLKNKQLCNYF